MKYGIKKLLGYLGYEIRRTSPVQYSKCVSLKTKKNVKGNALLAYILEPFLLGDGESPSQSHTHHTESLLIAEALLNSGYNVDVIDYRNRVFSPVKSYNFFISARTNFVRISDRLNRDCIKIAHLDTAHFLFNNSAAYRRALEHQQRKGLTSTSFRCIEHNLAVEHADYLTVLGNGFTRGTYDYSNKQIFTLPVPAPNVPLSSSNKDFSACRKNFLWLGSGGLVHKGLDLVLDVFSELPDYHLTVCGPLDDPGEAEFRQQYFHELYKLPNIHAVGWVDVSSNQFSDIASDCVALIYPSCSEGQAGSVITSLQAGLIPLISYESGVDVHEFGVILNECSHSEIKDVIQSISAKQGQQLEEMSRKAYEYVKSFHAKEKYTKDFENIIATIEHESAQNPYNESSL
jgi:glycosyltransferase involved in cell wall biosynthesis